MLAKYFHCDASLHCIVVVFMLLLLLLTSIQHQQRRDADAPRVVHEVGVGAVAAEVAAEAAGGRCSIKKQPKNKSNNVHSVSLSLCVRVFECTSNCDRCASVTTTTTTTSKTGSHQTGSPKKTQIYKLKSMDIYREACYIRQSRGKGV